MNIPKFSYTFIIDRHLYCIHFDYKTKSTMDLYVTWHMENLLNFDMRLIRSATDLPQLSYYASHKVTMMRMIYQLALPSFWTSGWQLSGPSPFLLMTRLLHHNQVAWCWLDWCTFCNNFPWLFQYFLRRLGEYIVIPPQTNNTCGQLTSLCSGLYHVGGCCIFCI